MNFPNACWLLIGVLLWYIFSTMVNIHWKSTFISYGLSKSTSNHYYQYAMLFTMVQFAVGAVTSFSLIVCSGKLENLRSLTSGWKNGLLIGGLFFLGQLSTNICLTMNSVTLTHMVKTLEPLLALVWSLTILENNISCTSMIHMIIMVVGVLLASYTKVTFNLISVIFAIVSNVSLSLRNLFIKMSNNNKMLNGLHLFFVSCIFGFIYSLSLYLFINKSFINNEYHCFSKESIEMGIYFSGQHIMSYLLLYYLSITSHALMNCLKRALIICISSMLLEVKMSTNQIIGIIITTISSIFYVYENKKHLNGKPINPSSSCSGTFAQLVGYKFSTPYKCMLVLLLTLLVCLTITDSNQYNRFYPRKLIHKQITAVWAFDAEIDMRTLELVEVKLATSYFTLNIFCYNVEKCQRSVNEFNSRFLYIQIKQLKAFEISKESPVAAWMAAHPINKIKSLTCFPAYFHKMMYLSALWKYGGIVIDMALNVRDNSDMKDIIISSSFQGCIIDKSKSAVIICNLQPKHTYTEVLIGVVSKLLMKNPKFCTFDRSIQYPDNLTKLITSSFGYKIPSPERQFGLLGYGATYNLGDEMQSIATAHILPHIHTIMNRQTFTNKDATNLTYISNAWWNAGGILFKDISNLIPVPVAVHISPTAYGRLKSSKSLLTAMAPIGARDLTSCRMLIKHGIASIFTGCVTLWMKNPNAYTNLMKNNQIIIVDIIWKLKHMVLPKTLRNIKYMSHKWGPNSLNPHVRHFSMEEKFSNTYDNLIQYAQAKVVITSRIHVALPCVAMGTSVIFVNSKDIWDNGKNPSSRVAGLLDLFHTVDMYKINETTALEYFQTFDWNNPPPNPNPEKVKELKREARRILERIPELAVSLKVLELT